MDSWTRHSKQPSENRYQRNTTQECTARDDEDGDHAEDDGTRDGRPVHVDEGDTPASMSNFDPTDANVDAGVAPLVDDDL